MELHGTSSANTPTFQVACGTSGVIRINRTPSPSNFINSTLEIAREPGFVGLVRLSALLPEQIVQPGTVGLQLLPTTAIHQSEVQPSCSISDGSDLIADVRPGVFTHLPLEAGVGK